MKTALEEAEVVILGAGLCGLSAAAALGQNAVVIEREERPGGLVRTTCIDGYWFDHVLHVLYFSDSRTEERVRSLLGAVLVECPPQAWVESRSGVARFPIQMNLGTLPTEVVVACVRDIARAAFQPHREDPANFEEMLLWTFGRSLCEEFLSPYNEKMWKRPLSALVPSGFQWTITQPALDAVIRGALTSGPAFQPYNAAGWYPRPPRDAPVRGIEVLSRALACQAADLRLGHEVESIDLRSRTVVVRTGSTRRAFRYRKACCSTLPLPVLAGLCAGIPEELGRDAGALVHNRVCSVALRIQGPRPEGRGCWRYYSDPSVLFNRLIYTHEFDPDLAPPNGWGLMAEITAPAEEAPMESDSLIARVMADIVRMAALPQGCAVLGADVLHVDPAYVVFTPRNAGIVARLREFLAAHDVMALGRFGRWEYSSMSQVMRDGFEWAGALQGGSVAEPDA